jgi:hypothetical protein
VICGQYEVTFHNVTSGQKFLLGWILHNFMLRMRTPNVTPRGVFSVEILVLWPVCINELLIEPLHVQRAYFCYISRDFFNVLFINCLFLLYVFLEQLLWNFNVMQEAAAEEEVSLGVIMTNTEIFHIFHIFSLFNLLSSIFKKTQQKRTINK